MLLALSFPLLLNGQTFTNDLLGIGFAAIGIALTIKTARGEQQPTATRKMARIIVWSGIALTLLLIAMLPSAYRSQTGFNRRTRELHQRAERMWPVDAGSDKINRGRPVR